MHEFGRARREFGYANDRALAGADVIVALDETRALRRIGLFRIVDRHLVGRPDLAPGDMRAPEPADRLELLVCLDDGFAVRVMPGADPPHCKAHAFPPSFLFPPPPPPLILNTSPSRLTRPGNA